MKKELSSLARGAVAVVLCFTLVLVGCSTDWVEQAEQIVTVMIPAATNMVALVALLEGKGVSAADLQLIQGAGAQAGADLQLIRALIEAYQKADLGAKAGILNQIQNAITVVQGRLEAMLGALHIKDAATQAKISAVVGILLAEVQSLGAVVPLVKGQAVARGQWSVVGEERTDRAGQSQNPRQPTRDTGRVKAPLSAGEFVASYNSAITTKTGNAELDRASAGLRIHLHGTARRWATAGVVK